MFEIQEDHATKILSVAKKVNATMANVSKLVKTIMTAWMMIIVWTICACPKQVSAEGLVAPIDPTLLSLQTWSLCPRGSPTITVPSCTIFTSTNFQAYLQWIEYSTLINLGVNLSYTLGQIPYSKWSVSQGKFEWEKFQSRIKHPSQWCICGKL